MSLPAGADLHIAPWGSAQASYDSNLFALSSRQEAQALNGDANRADTITRTAAGADASYLWGRQELHASAEGRRFNYEHFSQLTHDEYLWDSGLDGAVGDIVSGAVDFRQERRMAPFTDRTSTELSLETERQGLGHLTALVTPEWRLRLGGKIYALDSPLPGYPGFALSERSGNGAVEYLGYGKAAVGLYGEYLLGQFAGVPDAERYRQTTADLTADYSVSGLSRLNTSIGYTLRRSRDGSQDNVSGFTGSLAYNRRFSGKTSGGVQLFRRVSSYVGGANSEVDTGAGVDLRWEWSVKLAVGADYSWTRSVFGGLSAGGSTSSGRRDGYQITSLKLEYKPRRWLTLQPFAAYQSRTSNVAVDSFNDANLGLTIIIRPDSPGADDPAGAWRKGQN